MELLHPDCPRCGATDIVRSGTVKARQRYRCKSCQYNFSVNKLGKRVDSYYVVKALQLYLEGLSYREIERLLGVSHVSVMNWVRSSGLKKPPLIGAYRPSYKVLTQKELAAYFAQAENLHGQGMVVTELGDKYMLIRWERFR